MASPCPGLGGLGWPLPKLGLLGCGPRGPIRPWGPDRRPRPLFRTALRTGSALASQKRRPKGSSARPALPHGPLGLALPFVPPVVGGGGGGG
jgi:hypothetical protein